MKLFLAAAALILPHAALAASPLPDPVKNYAAYERYTHGEFRCDDRPYSKGCGNEPPGPIERRLLRLGFVPYYAYELAHGDPAERKRAIEVMKLCGPSGANDDDGVNVSCDAMAWDWRHRRYVEMCGTADSAALLADPEHRPRRGDPWVRWYRLNGESLKNARIDRADDVVNGCDE